MDANLDYIAKVVDIDAVGPLRVIKAFMPLLEKSSMTAFIANISSEAGSIGKCYRTNMIDYGNAKAPFDPYDSAEIMRKLFEERRENKTGDVFLTYDGNVYPW